MAGNVNKVDRMSAKDMVMQLKQLAEEGEISIDEVPEIKTVEGWITRYSAHLRKESAEQRVMGESHDQSGQLKTNKRSGKNTGTGSNNNKRRKI